MKRQEIARRKEIFEYAGICFTSSLSASSPVFLSASQIRRRERAALHIL